MKVLPQHKPGAKSVACPAPERGVNAWLGSRRRTRRLLVSLTAPLALYFFLCVPGAANGQGTATQTADGTATPLPRGASPNGASPNGAPPNGAPPNGAPPNGASSNTSALSGSNLNSAVWRTRVSLKVRDAPLAQVLALLENMAPVRFRYGALPDAVVSADLRDVALLPALEYLLRGVSWQTRHADTEIFLLRRQTPQEVADQLAGRPASPGNSAFTVPAAVPGAKAAVGAPGAPAAVAGWRYWSGVLPPARRWMTMEEPKTPAASRAGATVRNGAETGGATGAAEKDNLRDAESPDTSLWWRDAAILIEAQRRPGIRVLVPSVPLPVVPTPSEEANTGRAQPVPTTAGQAPVWLRWRMRLSFVPRDARLLLETPVAATLYVNGAPMPTLSRWSGMRIADLSYVLHRGDNVLALHWPLVPREMLGASAGAGVAAPAGAGDDTPAPALLRYEWLCDAFGGAVTGEEG